MFQFQNGTIKFTENSEIVIHNPLFQFQNGTIKFKHFIKFNLSKLGFNSKMVRLNYWFTIGSAITTTTFQFQNGTIKFKGISGDGAFEI